MAREDLLERVHVEAFRVVGDPQHACSRLLHRDERAHERRRLGDYHVPGTDDRPGHQVDRLTAAVGDDDLIRVAREASCSPTLCELLAQRPETVRVPVGQCFRARRSAKTSRLSCASSLTGSRSADAQPSARLMWLDSPAQAPRVGDDLA